MLDIACLHDSDVFGVVVGLVPDGFTEDCRAYPRSHCEHVSNMHNVQHFEIHVASATHICITRPFDIVAGLCSGALLRTWKDTPLCEPNCFRHVHFGWSFNTHQLFSEEFRRMVHLVILNITHRAEPVGLKRQVGGAGRSSCCVTDLSL
jgi:hypothetical protein